MHTCVCDDKHGHALEGSLATPGNLNYITSLQYGNTALYEAALDSDEDFAVDALEDSSLVFNEDRDGALRLLLESKANVNAANHVRCGGWSYCMCGIMHGAGILV
jgi:hypothetical protein